MSVSAAEAYMMLDLLNGLLNASAQAGFEVRSALRRAFGVARTRHPALHRGSQNQLHPIGGRRHASPPLQPPSPYALVAPINAAASPMQISRANCAPAGCSARSSRRDSNTSRRTIRGSSSGTSSYWRYAQCWSLAHRFGSKSTFFASNLAGSNPPVRD